MAKKGINLFGNPEGEKMLKRFLKRHPEAAGSHLGSLPEPERKKFLEDAQRQRTTARKRSRKKIPDSVAFRVFKRDGNRCHYCGTPASEVKLQIDHVIPVSKGGTDNISNLVAACPRCNRGKSNRY